MVAPQRDLAASRIRGQVVVACDVHPQPHARLHHLKRFQIGALGRVESVTIDRDYRKKQDGLSASDHAPVYADLQAG